MADKYRIYCKTDKKHEYVISNVAPAVCPIDPKHNVVADSVVIVKENVTIGNGDIVSLPLADYKKLKHDEVDLKTQSLIAGGFAYDGSTFSLSVHAQANWNVLKDNKAEFAFPKLISTIDNNDYSLDQANVTAFWTAGKDLIEGHLDSGRALKKLIFDAMDQDAVDAVNDNR